MKHSILDAVQIPFGGTSRDGLDAAIDLARDAEAMGCERYWIVEHHNVPFEATPAPEVFAAALAGATQNLRIGVGGILLNHHSPYKTAEAFRTLQALFPGRIDLGVGRASSGAEADIALMRHRDVSPADDHTEMLTELTAWLSHQIDETGRFEGLRIMGDLPAGPTPWVLAATENSAARAAEIGIPLACSGFHNPIKSADVLANYHANFQPSRFAAGIAEPQSLLALRVFAGETQEDGERLAMPMRLAFNLRRQHNIRLARMPDADEAIAQMGGLVPAETELWSKLVVGSYDGVMEKIEQMVAQTGVKEIMVQVFSPDVPRRRECHQELAARLARL